jgi:hypothetical protein
MAQKKPGRAPISRALNERAKASEMTKHLAACLRVPTDRAEKSGR